MTIPHERCFHKCEHDHRKCAEEILKANLTRDNYREKFHQLLCQEEDEHEKILKERYQNASFGCKIHMKYSIMGYTGMVEPTTPVGRIKCLAPKTNVLIHLSRQEFCTMITRHS